MKHLGVGDEGGVEKVPAMLVHHPQGVSKVLSPRSIPETCTLDISELFFVNDFVRSSSESPSCRAYGLLMMGGWAT